MAPTFHSITTPMRTALLLTFFAYCLHANAVTVSIYVYGEPLCSSATGSVSAAANGGVGPYTYLWSPGGETTADINNLLPGTYSVTVTDFNGDQATDQVVLASVNYDHWTSAMYYSGLCNGSWVVEIYPEGSGLQAYGPPPYYVDGQMMQQAPDGGYFLNMGQPGGSYFGETIPMSFTDGNGCSGTLHAYCGWPLVLPAVTVLDVQGSCSGGNNGSITFTVDAEAHHQQVDYRVSTTSQAQGTLGYDPTGPMTASGLAHGDHWIILSGGYTITQSGFGCYDSVLVNVPDLGTICGSVSGKVYMDNNADCANQYNEPGVPGALLEVLPGPYYALTNSTGAIR